MGMGKGYSAFGLTLRSSFVLPGMTPAETSGLPEVVLELESPAELAASWSGPQSPAPWRGKLGDGEDLAVEWGRAGDLLFAYGARAQFRLDPERSRLGCAPRDPRQLDWQRVLLTRILPNVSLARGREALHAGAVETPLGVVAIVAPSGMGKSTLAIELMRRGWPLFADDSLALERTGPSLLAHPSTPHTNLPIRDHEAPAPERLGAVLGTLAGERWIAAHKTSREARPVAAIALLERRPGLRLEAQPLPASPLALAPYMLGLPDDADRDAARFALYSDLVDDSILLRLSGDVGDRPADLADTLERALGLETATPLQGVA